MQCVVAYGAAVPWAMQVGRKWRHVVWGLSRRSVLATTREFVQLKNHKTTSHDPFSFSDYCRSIPTAIARKIADSSISCRNRGSMKRSQRSYGTLASPDYSR